jgi:hypothetical protein
MARIAATYSRVFAGLAPGRWLGTLRQRAWGVAERAWDVAERAWGVAERAWGVAERAWGVAERARGVAERAWGVAERAWGVAERAWGVAERARGVAERARSRGGPTALRAPIPGGVPARHGAGAPRLRASAFVDAQVAALLAAAMQGTPFVDRCVPPGGRR